MGPTNIPRFIAMTTKKPLEKPSQRRWLDCVRDNAPNGIVATIQQTNPEGQPVAVVLVARELKGSYQYVIPLTRDLVISEIKKIVNMATIAFSDLDFDIETNETKLIATDRTEITLDADKHMALCMALAKQRHTDWVRERTDAGWRFGVEYDDEDKTHPMLRPWEQLSDRFRVPDLSWPQKLISLLQSQGYAVIEKEALDRLVQLVRNGV